MRRRRADVSGRQLRQAGRKPGHIVADMATYAAVEAAFAMRLRHCIPQAYPMLEQRPQACFVIERRQIFAGHGSHQAPELV